MKQSKTSNTAFQDKTLQLIVSSLIMATYTVATITSLYVLYVTITSSPGGVVPDMYSYFTTFTAVLPLLVVLVAFYMRSPTRTLTRLFDAVMVSLMYYAAYFALYYMTYPLFQQSLVNTGSSLNFAIFESAVNAVVLIVLFGGLIYLKRQKKW